ncbi:MAG: hypothetical protein CMJ18_02735 [Phycisphaeraceae bacterium]|nr:hypothetical protein [Phycisphaeraceae bacterium]
MTSLEDDGGPGTLRTVLSDALPGTTIDFAVTGRIDLIQGPLRIDKDLAIEGPGATLLTIGGSTVSRIVDVDDGDDGHVIDVTLSRLTFADGLDTGYGGALLNDHESLTLEEVAVVDSRVVANGGGHAQGGAIYSVGGVLDIRDSRISGSKADNGEGGGIYSGGGMLLLTDVTITDNRADFGGGVKVHGGTALIRDGEISRNDAINGGGLENEGGHTTIEGMVISENTTFDGGGLQNVGGGRLDVVDSVISGNIAELDGGGLFNDGGSASGLPAVASLTRVLVADNTAYSNGGGINNDGGSGGSNVGGTVTVIDSTIRGNYSDSSGGAIFVDGGSGDTAVGGRLVISGSTLNDNRAARDGGAVYIDGGAGDFSVGGTVEISNSTFSGNVAEDDGGAIYNDRASGSAVGGMLKVDRTTITDNLAESGDGGAIRHRGELATIHGSILSGNFFEERSAGFENDLAGDIDPASSFNLFGALDGDVPTGPGNIMDTIDPGLLPLGDYGGSTRTHALEETSPALDQGGSAVVPAPTFDQRGTRPRVVDLGAVPNAAGGDGSDIGSFELLTGADVAATKRDELLLDADGDGDADPGDQVRYHVTILNVGDADATVVVFTDEIDPETTLLSGAGTTYQHAVGTLAAGTSMSFTFDVEINASFPPDRTTISNQGVVSGSNITDVLSDDPDVVGTDNPTVTDVPQTDVSVIVGDVPEPVTFGNLYSYFVTVANGGLQSADDVIVSASLPSGVSFDSAPAPCDHIAGEVTCDVGTLPRLATVTFEIRVVGDIPAPVSGARGSFSGDAATSVTATFDVQASTHDADPSNNQVMESTELSLPVVEQVLVSGSQWTDAFRTAADSDPARASGFVLDSGANQLRTLPWTNADEIQIVFDRDVTVQQDDLGVYGVTVPQYAFAGFAYDPALFRATWTLTDPFGRQGAENLPDGLDNLTGGDRVLLVLSEDVNVGGTPIDGTNPAGDPKNFALPSGDGVSGGQFRFQFHVHPGDATRDNRVNIVDTVNVRNRAFQSTTDGPWYTIFHDLDGSGHNAIEDTLLARNRTFTQLPGGAPVEPAPGRQEAVSFVTEDLIAGAAALAASPAPSGSEPGGAAAAWLDGSDESGDGAFVRWLEQRDEEVIKQ